MVGSEGASTPPNRPHPERSTLETQFDDEIALAEPPRPREPRFQVVPPEYRSPWRHGDWLYTEPVPPHEWLPFLGQPEYMEKRATNLLVATFKAGKTTLLTQCMWDWLRDDRLVFMISEESEAQWMTRLKDFAGSGLYGEDGWYTGDDDWYTGDNGPLSNLRVLPAMGLGFKELIGELRTVADLGQHFGIEAAEFYRRSYLANTVVILDTTKLLQVQDANEEGQWNAALIPIIKFQQDAGCTVIVVHHTRKGDGKHGEEIAGSHVIGALVDNLITIRRDGDEETTPRRSVHARGRFMSDKTGLYERVEVVNDHGVGTGRFELRWIGTKDTRTVEARVRQALTEDWQPSKTIIDAAKASKSQVLEVLNVLLEAGVVERKPSGDRFVNGQTVYWRKVGGIDV